VTLNGHFTLNFHYYEQRFQKLLYTLTVEHIYRIFLSYHVTSRDVRKRTDFFDVTTTIIIMLFITENCQTAATVTIKNINSEDE